MEGSFSSASPLLERTFRPDFVRELHRTPFPAGVLGAIHAIKGCCSDSGVSSSRGFAKPGLTVPYDMVKREIQLSIDERAFAGASQDLIAITIHVIVNAPVLVPR